MAFPNTPLDPVPAVWGWPWHGPLSWNGTAGWVSVPSGRTVPVTSVTHWTYLWDIGMPVATVESDDPDEQWWNVAVLRAPRGGGVLYAYGGQTISAGAILLNGLVGQLGLVVTSDSDNHLIRITPGVGVMDEQNHWVGSERTITIPWADLGITIPGPQVTNVEAQVLDRKPDGSGMILRLMRSYPQLISAEETVALLELKLSGTFADLVATHEVLASGEGCRGRLTVAADPGENPGTIVTGGISRARVGEFICDYSIDSDHWAWYGEDGAPQIVHFTARAVGTVTRTASVSGAGADMLFSSSKQEGFEYTYTIAAGGLAVTVPVHTLVTSSATAYGASGEHTEASGTMVVDFGATSVLNDSASSDTPGGIDEISYFRPPEAGSIPALIPAMYARQTGGFQGVQPLLAFAGVSNLAVEILLRYPDNVPTVFVPEQRYYTPALTPTGTVGEPFTYKTSQGQNGGLDLASYNPVTQQCLRHLDLPAFGWV
ncbi:hypothetical protein JVX91_00515 [Pseudomonas sp. PDNC002]|uniref:hypothetical protein n=1 Tax=Pseudomonas sp. PDNC002 TaxID=2811422 RepID=UPI0019642CD8|nr:hypothetical protein [Pseudomonas sp. PDNC002]QRY79630.1 hypothetical protein JVX91_00515 [Pseudomonas sp. PDNC002]